MEKLKISKVEDVHALSDGGKQFTGTLHLTNHHLIYRCKPIHLRHDEPPAKSREVWITYHMIHRCTFRPVAPTSKHRASIRLSGKDFLLITFNFSDTEKARKVFETMKDLTCKLPSIDKLYAFTYRGNLQENALAVNGWQLYNPKAEFKRQGISEKAPDRGWRLTNINHDYQFSPTYPAQLWVPSSISDNVIKYAGAFRSKIRIPALTYLHPVNNCSITRCSQPMTGLGRGNRNAQDERFVAACFSASPRLGFDTPDAKLSPYSSQANIAEAAHIQDENTTEAMEDSLLESAEELSSDGPAIYGAQQRNLIVDARPTLNATMNAAMGKGSENMENYKFAVKEYLGIENIHAMRDSLNCVIQALKDGDMTSLPPNRDLLAKSKWIKYNTSILDGSALIARQVGIHHSHVMIHCSDGWDRTSQLSALAQIMLDPYYRTLEGFMVLVEKDWVSFGHMFGLRCGHLSLEKWFKTEGGGSSSSNNAEDGDENTMPRNEAIETLSNFGKRLFSKKVPTGEVDSDGEPIYDEAVDPNRPAGWKQNEQTKPGDVSPVFHQFLDCTHQLLIQHPTRFEFTDRFLRRLFYHLYACQYGTFLWNSEKERKRASAEERTKSVWDYFLADRSKWINPQYDGGEVDDTVRGKERLIFPQLDRVRWWAELFNRRDEEMNGDVIPGAVRSGNGNTGTSTPSRENSTGVVVGVQTANELIAPAGASSSDSSSGGGGVGGGIGFGHDGARSPRRENSRSGDSGGSDQDVVALEIGEWPWPSDQEITSAPGRGVLGGLQHVYREKSEGTSGWWGRLGRNNTTDDMRWRIPGEGKGRRGSEEVAWVYDPHHDTIVRPKTAPLPVLPAINLDEAEGTISEADKRELIRNGIYKVLSQDSALSSEHPGGHEVVLSIPEIIRECGDDPEFDAGVLVTEGGGWEAVVRHAGLIGVDEKEETREEEEEAVIDEVAEEEKERIDIQESLKVMASWRVGQDE